jgi:NAD(P)H-binding
MQVHQPVIDYGWMVAGVGPASIRSPALTIKTGGGPTVNVTLTGSTGFIGSHILTDLQQHGHAVTALVRDDAQADSVAALGATPAVVDLYDQPTVTNMFSSADGAIHTASPGDATSANLDSAVVDAVTAAFAGTGKPYLQISGNWIYGDNLEITEESPIKAPAMVAWKEPIERRVLDAAGMRGVVIIASVAYGDGGGGVPGLLLASPRDDAGNLIMLGTGQRLPAPTMRPGRAWASISPRYFWSTRPPTRPGLRPSSTGIRPIPRSPMSSATGATG